MTWTIIITICINNNGSIIKFILYLLYLFLVRGGCIPSVRRATWIYRNFSSAATLKSKMRIGYNSAMVEKNSSGRFCEFNGFVFDIQKWVSACISPLYACFFNFKIEARHCIFNAWLRYLTINYFETGLYGIWSERLYYSYFYPSKLSSIDIEPIE